MEQEFNLWEVLRRTAVGFSRIWRRKITVLLRTAVRCSHKFHFMEHHSATVNSWLGFSWFRLSWVWFIRFRFGKVRFSSFLYSSFRLGRVRFRPPDTYTVFASFCPNLTAGPCQPHCPNVRISLENAVYSCINIEISTTSDDDTEIEIRWRTRWRTGNGEFVNIIKSPIITAI